MESLSELFRHLGNSLELEEVLCTLDRELHRLIAYRFLAVLLNEAGGFTVAYSSGGDAHGLAEVTARAARDHRAIQQDQALFFPLEPAAEQERTAMGVIVLERDGPQLDGANAFTDADLEILRSLSPKLAASIENARKFRRAEQLAVADPLTGLANIRSLFQRLDAELARARRNRGTLAVLQCSISGFDRSGRLCSQSSTWSAFEKVALTVRESCREYDFAARSGVDLVLVLPGFRPESLREKRESIQRIVEEIGVSAGLPLFATVGAAFYPENGTDAEDLLAAAARQLTAARGTECPNPLPLP